MQEHRYNYSKLRLKYHDTSDGWYCDDDQRKTQGMQKGW